MTPERRAYIETMADVAHDFSDGAFWGFMLEECGIETDEILEVFPPSERATEGDESE